MGPPHGPVAPRSVPAVPAASPGSGHSRRTAVGMCSVHDVTMTEDDGGLCTLLNRDAFVCSGTSTRAKYCHWPGPMRLQQRQLACACGMVAQRTSQHASSASGLSRHSRPAATIALARCTGCECSVRASSAGSAPRSACQRICCLSMATHGMVGPASNVAARDLS